MNGFDIFKKNLIIKAVIIPIVVTLIAVVTLNFLLPTVQAKLPNGVAYASQVEEADSNE